MLLDFDETNLLADVVGESNGLTGQEIKQHSARAREALRNFQKLSEEGRYGFPHLPFQTGAKDILKFARDLRGSYDTVCLVGIGGSALGAWALDCALRGPHPVQRAAFSPKFPRLVVLDNVDPSFVSAALDSMHPRRTVVVVAAKSGSTAETVANFLVVREWLGRKLGRKANRRIAAITSADRGDLVSLATQEQYRTFVIPENVGGRFSVLSPVGMVPAALLGIDIRKLFKGAMAITHECWRDDLKKNIALRSALLHYLLLTERKKSIQVALPYSNRLWGTAFWFRQLWAESLGKAEDRGGLRVNAGQTPIAALGVTDQHSQVQLYIEGPNDKVFTFWTVHKHPGAVKIPKARVGLEAFDYLGGKMLAELIDIERRSTEAALVEAQRPNCAFTLEKIDEEHLGAFLQMMEFETAFMGELLNIDAFNQPGVELGKRFTYALMGRAGYDPYRARFEAYEKKRKSAG